MGCGCGGTSSDVTYTYLHTRPNGEQTSYKSEYEAKAAVLREGGNYIPVPVT